MKNITLEGTLGSVHCTFAKRCLYFGPFDTSDKLNRCVCVKTYYEANQSQQGYLVGLLCAFLGIKTSVSVGFSLFPGSFPSERTAFRKVSVSVRLCLCKTAKNGFI